VTPLDHVEYIVEVLGVADSVLDMQPLWLKGDHASLDPLLLPFGALTDNSTWPNKHIGGKVEHCQVPLS